MRLLNRFYCHICGELIVESKTGYEDEYGDKMDVDLCERFVCHRYCIKEYNRVQNCQHEYEIFEEYIRSESILDDKMAVKERYIKMRCKNCNKRIDKGNKDAFTHGL